MIRRSFVRGVFLLESVNEVIMAYEALNDFKLTFDRQRHEQFRFAWLWLYVLGGLSAYLTVLIDMILMETLRSSATLEAQCFYAQQLHHMGRSKVMTAFIALVMIPHAPTII